MDPYCRAKAKEAAIAARDVERPIRSLEDLYQDAEVDADVRVHGCTLAELKESLKPDREKKSSSGRVALLARLKEAGIAKLGDRQKLANVLCTAMRERRLRPSDVSAASSASDSSSAASTAPSTQSPAPSSTPPKRDVEAEEEGRRRAWREAREQEQETDAERTQAMKAGTASETETEIEAVPPPSCERCTHRLCTKYSLTRCAYTKAVMPPVPDAQRALNMQAAQAAVRPSPPPYA